MVRPAAKEAKQQFTVMLKPSVVQELDRMAEKAGLTRSQFMGNLIELGLDQVRIMETTGVFKVAVISRDLMAAFMKKVYSGKVALDKKGDLKIEE